MKSLGVYQALNTTFELQASRGLASYLSEAYADLLAPPDAAPQHVVEADRRVSGWWCTRVDGQTRERDVDDSAALHDVRRAINDLAVASVADTDTVLNAGGIEIDGVAVAVVGPSAGGKSTLTAAAALRGHGFLADDVVAIDPTGNVRPFQRPVGIRSSEAVSLGITIPPGPFDDGYPLRVGKRSALCNGAPLGLIVIVGRCIGATWMEPREPAAALMQLANQALRLPNHERLMFRRLETLVRCTPAIELGHMNIEPALRFLERAVAERDRLTAATIFGEAPAT